jgi:hypothetical protein
VGARHVEALDRSYSEGLEQRRADFEANHSSLLNARGIPLLVLLRLTWQ